MNLFIFYTLRDVAVFRPKFNIELCTLKYLISEMQNICFRVGHLLVRQLEALLKNYYCVICIF